MTRMLSENILERAKLRTQITRDLRPRFSSAATGRTGIDDYERKRHGLFREQLSILFGEVSNLLHHGVGNLLVRTQAIGFVEMFREIE